jgi:hypothetical protein
MNNIVLGLTNIFVALLMIVVCLPLAKRKIKMNCWYGMRIPKAFTSDENWYRINEYGGRQFIYWSVPNIVLGLVMLFLPPMGAGDLWLVVLPPFILLVPLIKLFIYAGRL